jgi:plasmid maintenance system antidote protein VapI
MKRLKNIHSGEILLEEFLKPMGVSAYRLSKDTGIPQKDLGHNKRKQDSHS